MKIPANMSGLINKIVVREGDSVRTGETLAVIESMKMLIDVKTETAGVVAKIMCGIEDFVQEGDDLFELEVGDDASTLSNL